MKFVEYVSPRLCLDSISDPFEPCSGIKHLDV